MTYKNNFYLSILNYLKFKTNLKELQKKLSISKQRLNYYLRELKKGGYIQSKGYGWYELTNKSKNMTKYGNFLSKDISRGHAYIWEIKLLNKPENWDNRLSILKKKKVNHILVGAKETTPRIKALGRKVWLCNNKLRIFDTKKSSYYGDTAIESRKNSFLQLLRIVGVLENKLGINLRPFDWKFKKEHYALIKNDFAIDQNNKGIIIRVSDETGEWLLVDDSLGQGGELETIGKKAFETNIPMQKWWNDNKKHKFKVTPSFLMENMNNLVEDRRYWAKHQKSHIKSIQTLGDRTDANSKTIELLANVVRDLKDEVKKLNGKK